VTSLKDSDVVGREEDGCKVVSRLDVVCGDAKLKEVVVGEMDEPILIGTVKFDDDLEVDRVQKLVRRDEQSLVLERLSVSWTDVGDEVDDGLFDGPDVVSSGDHRTAATSRGDARGGGVVFSVDQQVPVDQDSSVAEDVAL